eukprot:GHVU01033158.1.p1 GENE.GHVU01033158.1~~GHVU01033158.1.p1  ORF type:complete len:111 (-),score=2.64 GHVU01033158.1:238-570(-)
MLERNRLNRRRKMINGFGSRAKGKRLCRLARLTTPSYLSAPSRRDLSTPNSHESDLPLDFILPDHVAIIPPQNQVKSRGSIIHFTHARRGDDFDPIASIGPVVTRLTCIV